MIMTKFHLILSLKTWIWGHPWTRTNPSPPKTMAFRNAVQGSPFACQLSCLKKCKRGPDLQLFGGIMSHWSQWCHPSKQQPNPRWSIWSYLKWLKYQEKKLVAEPGSDFIQTKFPPLQSSSELNPRIKWHSHTPVPIQQAVKMLSITMVTWNGSSTDSAGRGINQQE